MTGKEETGIFTLYSDVEATAVRWLWYPFIAVGKITLLQGDPGDGKSTMMMNLIAELSKGGTMPDGKSIGMPQKVIYQCSEDDASDTIKPRLETCGADCRSVAFINEEMNSGWMMNVSERRLYNFVQGWWSLTRYRHIWGVILIFRLQAGRES